MEKKVNILVAASTQEEIEKLKAFITEFIPLKLEVIDSFSSPQILSLLEREICPVLILICSPNSEIPLELLKLLPQRVQPAPEVILIASESIPNLKDLGVRTCLLWKELSPEILMHKVLDACLSYLSSFSADLTRQVELFQIQALLKALPEGIIMLDESDQPKLVNPAAESYLKFLNPNCQSQKVKEVKEVKEILEHIKKGDEFAVKELLIPGRNLFLRIEGLFLRKPSGDGWGSLILIRDVSEEKKADRMKEDFISVVSHELRTPLTTMKEFVSILLDEIPGRVNSEQREYLQIVDSNIERLARIINEILEIAQIESGKVQLRRELIAIDEIARAVVEELEALAAEKGLELKLEVPETSLTVYGDRDKLQQVFFNLITNAIKFTPEGEIRVKISQTEDKILSEIQDTGIGIARSNLPKVFSKFQQFERNSEMGSWGIGLGLSITRYLVELHRGRIWVSSELGKGSIFKFELPKFTPQQALLDLCAENLHRCIMANKGFSLILIEFVEPASSEKKAELEKIQHNLEARFKEALRREGDLLFRSQHMFAILLNLTGKEGALRVKERLLAALKQSLACKDKKLGEIRLRIGLASYPEDGYGQDLLLEKARQAFQEYFFS